MAKASAGRDFLDCLCVAAADHDVVGRKCRHQSGNDLADGLAPRLLADFLETPPAQVVSENLAVAPRYESELERDERVLHDERGAEPCAQSQKQHPAAFIT